jgi:hypothetical protein
MRVIDGHEDDVKVVEAAVDKNQDTNIEKTCSVAVVSAVNGDGVRP